MENCQLTDRWLLYMLVVTLGSVLLIALGALRWSDYTGPTPDDCGTLVCE